MKKITEIAGEAGTKLRDRSRSVKRRVFDIARAARSKAKQRSEKLTRAYDQLLNSTSRVVGQAKRFSAEIMAGMKRIRRGDTRSENKLLSVFEPSTEIIRKGKSGKPNEFGKMVKL
jgi:transposase, IS5 family